MSARAWWRWFVLTVLVSVPAGPAGAQSDTRALMVLTFDDLPAQTTRPGTTVYASVNEALLDALEAAGAPAIGFVNESKLYGAIGLDPARVDVLRDWLVRGHELGNHTFSHPDLHRVGTDAWLADVDRGDEVLEELWRAWPPATRYVRHPQLRTGRSDEEKARTAAGLDTLGYVVAPVTVDSQEWIFARAFDRAIDGGVPEDAERITAAYLEYMDAMVGYWERQAERLLGRSIPHVLLLHANRLNAATLPQLLGALERRGYHFGTLAEALRDPVYGRADGYYGPRGPSWILRWALAAGEEALALEPEPPVPDFVWRISGLEGAPTR